MSEYVTKAMYKKTKETPSVLLSLKWTHLKTDTTTVRSPSRINPNLACVVIGMFAVLLCIVEWVRIARSGRDQNAPPPDPDAVAAE